MIDPPLTSNAESVPLLAPRQSPFREANADLHDLVFNELDASHAHDEVHDNPPTPGIRRMRSHLYTAATAPGHGHPAAADHHMASPALLLRLKQSLDHGFHKVWNAVLHRLKPHNPRSNSSHHSSLAKRYALVRSVFIVALLTMLAMTSLSPTLLLFMNEAGYTSATNITPYVTASAIGTAAPIISNLMFTSIASNIGPGRALAFGSFTAAIGMLVIILSRGVIFLFYFGYVLYSMSNSLRIVRISLLSKIVPVQERTTVLATHALMTPIGALVGPVIWILAQNYRTSFHFLNWIVIDRFTITYSATLSAFLFIALIALTSLQHIVPISTQDKPKRDDDAPTDDSGADHNPAHFGDVVIRFSDGHSQTVNLEKYRNAVFIYFCLIWLGVNMSAGLYMTAFQPVLVNVFHVSDANLGLIFMIIAVFAVVPPLLVAVLSRHLMDRQILIVGLAAKLIGMSLFLPLWGPTTEVQVVAGFLLIIKASIFFSTASMSLFTKILGPMSTSYLLGLLASSASVGPALAQILLSSRIVNWFGSYRFGLFALPAIASMLAIIWPPNWRKLDHACEYVQLVTEEAEHQQSSGAS